MTNFRAAILALLSLFFIEALATPVCFTDTASAIMRRTVPQDGEAWQRTLSSDTRHRLEVAQQHLNDQSHEGQAFRNDTIMRVNIEREALDLPLIDLSQAFGIPLPLAHPTASSYGIRSNF